MHLDNEVVFFYTPSYKDTSYANNPHVKSLSRVNVVYALSGNGLVAEQVEKCPNEESFILKQSMGSLGISVDVIDSVNKVMNSK